MIESIHKHSEVNRMETRLDNISINKANWSNMVTKGTSPVLRRNSNMTFLIGQLDSLLHYCIDMPVVARNWFNYRVHKFYNYHIK